jgi:DUF1680 family protein
VSTLRHQLAAAPVALTAGAATALRSLPLSGVRVMDGFWAQRQGVNRTVRPGPVTPLEAIPYFAWANREMGPMRVWFPRDGRDEQSGAR